MTYEPLGPSPSALAALGEPRRLRDAIAHLLRGASAVLDRVAAQLAMAAPAADATQADPVIEFYAEAGAPEGALYVNGQLVGTLPGVVRL
jgi:hypothetical protein